MAVWIFCKKKLILVNLDSFYKLKLAKFVHKLANNELPIIFNINFVKTPKVHIITDNLSMHFASSLEQFTSFSQNQLGYCKTKLLATVDSSLKKT